MAQNSIENAVMGGLGGIYVSNPRFFSIFQSNIGSGDIDIYTVPAGKRAAIFSQHAYNSAASSTTWHTQIKVSGIYYRTSINSSTVAGLSTASVQAPSIILEPGETFSYNTSQAGLNVWSRVMEFDINTGLKTSKILGPFTGDNTVYTVPMGKSAWMLDRNLSINNSVGAFLASAAGASSTIDCRVVPNGGSPGLANSSINNAVSANGVTSLAGPKSLNAGDFVSYNLGTGDPGQMLWVSVMEI